MITPTGFLVLEALERAIIDTDVAIRPHQVMGWPVSLDGNHWLMKRIEIKNLTVKKCCYIRKCFLKEGENICYDTWEKYYFKNTPNVIKGLVL